jgi:hypothetical protein
LLSDIRYFARRANVPQASSLAPSGKSSSHFSASRPARGALRDLHECWAEDAMDVSELQRDLPIAPTNNIDTYGEVVWSWRRDADAKLVTMLLASRR